LEEIFISFNFLNLQGYARIRKFITLGSVADSAIPPSINTTPNKTPKKRKINRVLFPENSRIARRALGEVVRGMQVRKVYSTKWIFERIFPFYSFDFGLFFAKISIFDQNFDFWPKFRFLTKIAISDQNFDFWSKFYYFLAKRCGMSKTEKILSHLRAELFVSWPLQHPHSPLLRKVGKRKFRSKRIHYRRHRRKPGWPIRKPQKFG